MQISLSLEIECESPWRVSYEGFCAPGYTSSTALLKETRRNISGHQALTYEHLIESIAHDLPRCGLEQLPELVFSDAMGEALRLRTRHLLTKAFALSSQSL